MRLVGAVDCILRLVTVVACGLNSWNLVELWCVDNIQGMELNGLIYVELWIICNTWNSVNFWIIFWYFRLGCD